MMRSLAVLLVLASASAATAADGPRLLGLSPQLAAALEVPPAPGLAYEEPMVEGYITPMPESAALTLFECVKCKDLRNIHPCAVPMIVQVPDPCQDKASCCAPACVNVKVCVPPCDCPEVKCRRSGNKLILDYGKYSVSILSARGKVIVDYDD